MSNIVEKPKAKTFGEYLMGMQGELESIVPSFVSVTKLINIVLSQFRRNEKLRACTHSSIAGALMMMGQIGIEPVGGQAYLIPFNEKGVMQCQLVIGYPGLIELFYRHENSLSIYCETAYEGDVWEHELGSNPYIKHKPMSISDIPLYHYSVAQLKDGGTSIKVMTHDQCIKHGLKYSKTVKGGKFEPWSTWAKDPIPMCRKTVLRQHSKGLPLSYEMRRGIMADESVRNWLPGTKDFIELPNEYFKEEIENGQNFDETPPLKKPDETMDAEKWIPSDKQIEELEKAGIDLFGDFEKFYAWLSGLNKERPITSITSIVSEKQYKFVWAKLNAEKGSRAGK